MAFCKVLLVQMDRARGNFRREWWSLFGMFSGMLHKTEGNFKIPKKKIFLFLSSGTHLTVIFFPVIGYDMSHEPTYH